MEFPIKVPRNSIQSLVLNLMDFPTELIIKILSEIGWADILRCCTVSKSLYEIITGSVELRYLVELRSSGYSDAEYYATSSSTKLRETNTIPLTIRLQRLLKQESAWRNFNFTSPIPPSSSQALSGYEPNIGYQITHTSGIYELYGGVFVQGTRKPNNGHDRGAERLQMIQFGDVDEENNDRNAGKRKYGKIWRHDWLGIPIARDIGIDPGSDLLVLVESRPFRTAEEPDPPFAIYLKTMSTCVDHPMAIRPVLTHRVTRGWKSSFSFCMVVIGDLLAIMFCSHKSTVGPEGASELVIWNWKEGRVKAILTCDDYLARSVSFISPSTFVIPRFMPGQPEEIDEEVEDIDEPQPQSTRKVEASLNLYSIPNFEISPTDQPVTPVLIAKYEFPEFRSFVGSCTITSRSDPAPCPQYCSMAGDSAKPLYTPSNRTFSPKTTVESPMPTEPAPKPWFPDPEKRILVLSIYFRLLRRRSFPLGPTLDVDNVNHTVFVHSDAFGKGIFEAQRKELDTDGSETAMSIPWKQWSRYARWTDHEPQSRFVVFTYGQRYAEVVKTPDDGDVLRLWDFNPNNVGRPMSSPIIPTLRADSKQASNLEEPPIWTSPVVPASTSSARRLLQRLSLSSKSVSKMSTPSPSSLPRGESGPRDDTSIRFNVEDKTEESVVQDRTIFEGQGRVKSSLPYRTLTMKDALPFECEGVMLDDRRIVVVKKSQAGTIAISVLDIKE